MLQFLQESIIQQMMVAKNAKIEAEKFKSAFY